MGQLVVKAENGSVVKHVHGMPMRDHHPFISHNKKETGGSVSNIPLALLCLTFFFFLFGKEEGSEM
jgi:hypothetical protein